MNKTDLIEKIAAGSGLSKDVSKKALEATIVALKDALKAGDKIALVGFAILLAFSEGEWLQQNLACKTVVKATIVHDHIVDDP